MTFKKFHQANKILKEFYFRFCFEGLLKIPKKKVLKAVIVKGGNLELKNLLGSAFKSYAVRAEVT